MAQLPYPYAVQVMSEWCWCAAAASIGGFYRQTNALSQCAVADLVFGSGSCVATAPKPSLNLPKPLDAPLRKLKNLSQVRDGSLQFEDMAKEIDQGRPVGIRIQWSDEPGVGHMIVLSGYDRPTASVMVEDPKFGQAIWSFGAVAKLYRGRGFWSFTYLTRKHPNV
jgi:papain like cysteine protease AvrRpt2